MKTFYIHIGLHKTGTSSLQGFLYKNRDELKKHGINYPSTGACEWNDVGEKFQAHHLFPLSYRCLLDETSKKVYSKFGGKGSLQELLKELLEEVDLTDCKNIVISSEKVGYGDAGIDVLKEMSSFFRENSHCVKIIVYLRKQEDYAASMYSEILKTGQNTNLSGYLAYFEKMLNYHNILSTISGFVPKEDIIVRVYEKCQLIKNNTVDDFMQSAFSINSLDEFVPPSRSINKSYCCDTLEMRRLEVLLDDSTRGLSWYHSDINQYLFDYSDFAQSNNMFHPIKEIVPIDARIEMRERYREGNEKIAREFLHRADGVLFRETYSEPEVEYSGLTYEKACEIYEYVKTKHQLTNEAEQCFRNILFFLSREKIYNSEKIALHALQEKEIQALRTELRAMQNSTLWKVTKPLRKMVDTLRKK